MSEPEGKTQAVLEYPQKQGAPQQTPLDVVSTHPTAQAVAPFTGDFPLALFRQQTSATARTGAQHTSHLQHALLGTILLVPIVLKKGKGKVSFAPWPRAVTDDLSLPEALS